MAVNIGTMTELTRLEASLPPDRDGAEHLSAIETVDELFGFVVTDARAAGYDEADIVEMLARFSGMTAPEVRRIASVLRVLGYAIAADRLKLIAGKRHRALRPL